MIRLKDASPGFGDGSGKAVVTFYLLKQGSNVNNGNAIENLTIDTGKGNPGAVGLKWNASNFGTIRNLAIRSGDGAGRAGLLMDRRNAMGYLHDIRVEGFDVGIELTAKGESVVTLEYATLSRQRGTAIRIGGEEGGFQRTPPEFNCNHLSARKILTQDAPVALRADRAAQVVLMDSELTSTHDHAAALILETDGHLFARDVSQSGYRTAVVKDGTNVLNGAVGDGIADDTAAIQRAMRSGNSVVYFPKANYVINGTVDIPAGVKEIAWLFGCVHRSTAAEWDGPALLRVAEPSTEPLRIHGAVTAGGVFLDHDADRPVVLEDIYVMFHHGRSYAGKADMLFPSPAAQNTTVWRLYRNTRPEGETKEVFVNNCLFFAVAGDDQGGLALENVRVWARTVGCEHLPGAQYAFRRSDAWILGFKSENANQLFQAEDHSRLEVLGGFFLNWSPQKGPAIFARDSLVSVICSIGPVLADTILRDETKGVVSTLPATRFTLKKAGEAIIVVQ